MDNTALQGQRMTALQESKDNSKNLILSLTNLVSSEVTIVIDGKQSSYDVLGRNNIAILTREIMPGGIPNYKKTLNYPLIPTLLKEHGRKVIKWAIIQMLNMFCDSINVRATLDDNQRFEIADMLIDEAFDFRLEDYLMMFQMGKKCELGIIYNKVDISTISEMINVYWSKRNDFFINEAEQEEKQFTSGVYSDPTFQKALKIASENLQDWDRQLSEQSQKEREDFNNKRNAEIQRLSESGYDVNKILNEHATNN